MSLSVRLYTTTLIALLLVSTTAQPATSAESVLIRPMMVSQQTAAFDPANIQPITAASFENSQTDSAIAWFVDGKPVPAVAIVLDALKRAPEEALLHTNYNYPALAEQWASLQHHSDAHAQQAFSDALTRSATRYASDVRYGHYRRPPLDPRLEGYYEPPAMTGRQLLARVLASDNVAAALADLPPQHAIYRQLRAEYGRLRQQAEQETTQPISGGVTLRPGMTDSRVPVIAARLRKEGYLGADGTADTGLYSPAIVEAVRQWQTAQGLKADGLIGKNTLAVLNRSVADKKKQVAATMERWRWLPRDLGQRHVMVNIPSYTLEAVRDGETALHMETIVGQPDRQTPIFSTTMYGVIFKPAWNVPKSIAIRDKLPLIRKDPGYLKRNNYQVLNADGKALNPYSVSWHRYGENNFPLRLRQRPAEDSALGLIRFSLRNGIAIFLHDTGSRDLFAKAHRDLSSGCVRVSQPEKLAQFAFASDERWDNKRIHNAMYGSGREARHVHLLRELPVHLTYMTVHPDADGELRYHRDIYDLNNKLLSEMGGQVAETTY